MFSHRGLFLAVTIFCFLASIVFAGVLQPAEHQYNNKSCLLQHQSITQKTKTRQYRTKLPDQESTRYLREEYGHSSLQPLTVHNRRKRSDPTTIDSIIPINQPTDTTDKRLAKRESMVSALSNYLLSLLPKNVANAARYIYPLMVLRIGDTTVFEEIINMFGMLLGYYPSQTPTISGRASDGMHMFQQNLTAQDKLFSELIKRVEEHEENIVLEYAYPCLVARVKDTKMFQEIVKKLEYLLGHYPSQTPTISKPVYNGMHMHMISTAEPSQDNSLKIPFYSEITPETFYQYPIVGALYFDKTGRQCLKYYSYYPNNYPTQLTPSVIPL